MEEAAQTGSLRYLVAPAAFAFVLPVNSLINSTSSAR
jgi:hypothetical protein